MSEHTKTPWGRMGHVIYIGIPGSCDAETGKPLWGGFSLQHCPNPEANARHIVHCVNNHESLVAALDSAATMLEVAGYANTAKNHRELLALLQTEKGGRL